ncbi:hypothetical protein V6N13_133898 [Hibiscus sabdariffa]|uniref:DUF4283 domain-containing protein n=1 Tax=Hibiscus sabdariffa TaxID=183260 RepID=A0ABR2QZR1_9ROSI
MMKNTFAFVRFMNLWEALSAVDLANNRRMDDFIIKVFLDKKVQMVAKGPSSVERSKAQHAPTKVNMNRFKDERSYKDALLNPSKLGLIDENDGPINVPSVIAEASRPAVENKYEPISINIQDSDGEWLNKCLICQISAMYDAEVVQQFLQSEGFKVKVSCWYGFYAIIRFEEEEHIDIFWDLKDSLLKPWFSDIDSMEKFMKSKKLRIWVCIEGFPLHAWNDFAILSIGRRWGEVISLDTDTNKKNRFDVARILVGVNCLSDVPLFPTIEVKGVIYNLKISTFEYDDDRCWIDNEQRFSCADGFSDGFCNSSGLGGEGVNLSNLPQTLENAD